MSRSPQHRQRLDPGRRRCLGRISLLVTGLFLRPAWADPLVQRASRQLMGTQVDIVAQGDSADQAAAATAAAFAEMARLERIMSRYRIDSAVTALESAAGRRPLPVGPELFAALKMAQQVSEISQGDFDVTVGAFSGWDFSAAHENIPSHAELEKEKHFVNYRDLVLDEKNRSVYLRRPGMKIDLGGIAKLPILQAGLGVLEQHGIRHALLNGGGDVLVKGQLQGRDWRVGIRDPRAPERLVGVVELNQGFVASSGDYERCFVRNGKRYHHILDPKTGQPTQGPHGVALIARGLESVNGLGAAIMVGGTAAGRRWLAQRPEVDALIVHADERLWLSAGMAQRLNSPYSPA
ncbi:MAG: FAD:protein FMN transferase [Burkholderiaceae bacterium]|jgi:thiamine biosynthesis lipoprotein|nr:FAD:protein FMN transferase [Burkholderiaceae bacterium]